MSTPHPSRWFVTALSNLAPAYDKYSGLYDKARLPRARFPDTMFTLDGHDITIGHAKARDLVTRLARTGDQPIAIETHIPPKALHTDHASGLGAYPIGTSAPVASLRVPQDQGHPSTWPVWKLEDALAQSLTVLAGTDGFSPWEALQPRSLSWLPVGHACQASCAFCFSKASVSEGYQAQLARGGSLERLTRLAEVAAQSGAQRAVITGGGEPTLLKAPLLDAGIEVLARALGRTILITNGHLLGRTTPAAALARCGAWRDAGLSILALSRHAASDADAARLMGLDVDTHRAVDAAQQAGLTPRLIAVLQKGGIEDESSFDAYLDQAVRWGVGQINCKELYVSTALESDWSDSAANAYSAANAVPLSLITSIAAKRGWTVQARLPWGAPVFTARHNGANLAIAAYTEPSVSWERMHGLARSWNAMANGEVLASLEDSNSRITIDGF